jgi:hypothetical protein
MTRLCCPGCRLRFTPGAAAYLEACPGCGEPPHPSALTDTMGYRLFRVQHARPALPEAVAVSLPVPEL